MAGMKKANTTDEAYRDEFMACLTEIAEQALEKEREGIGRGMDRGETFPQGRHDSGIGERGTVAGGRDEDG